MRPKPTTSGLGAGSQSLVFMRELIIEPGRSEKNYWRDLWRYRELFYILAWRDISVRYKQTAIGVAWAVLRPFLANSLSEASTSLVVNTNLVSKVYFPRMIIPAGAVITSLVDLAISAALLGVLMIWFRFMPDWRLITLPLFTLMAFLAALGPGLFLTALNVKYRDFRYVIPFIVQFGLFISPVGFSSDVIPQNWRLLYSLNPIVGVIDGFRWAICRGQSQIYVPGLVLSALVIVFFLWLGVWYFRKTEKGFADVI